MIKKLYEKNEVTFSVIWIAAYVILFSAADSFSESLKIQKIITAPVGILFALILFFWIRKNDLLKKYGLCRFKGSPKIFLFFIPLIVLMSVNLWNGAAITVSIGETALHIIAMLCVGFIEEVIFRGFLFKAISKSSLKKAIAISSVTFGIGHIVNLLNGAELISTLLQICYAVAIGFLFTIIFYKGGSLLPCIIAHGVVNSSSIFAVQGSRIYEIAVSAAICVISVGYALWLLKNADNLPESDKSEN